MCGIAGIVTRKQLTDLELRSVRKTNARLAHRGPDGSGEYQDHHVALAMRRLSIIDLTGGWQPLYNEDQSLVLIANGEIYNFIELRKQLEASGHHFRTKSDCETILHLYEEYGDDCVTHLRGMFAFALWDITRKRLLVARDRMGEKPLYLYQDQDRLLFASEMKALLSSGLVNFELDPQAVHLYFHYQYVPEPLTAVKGVRKLDAAHLLVVDTENWKITDKQYWRMDNAPALVGNPVELIREQLETVSEIVIRSDVPVGIALSGGLDSSAIAALAARKYPGTMHAFSIGYPGQLANDERADARKLANHLGLPFHDMELPTGDLVSFFPQLTALADDPIADIAAFGYYSVMKLAREHNVPVVLQGQGGDELFWGYSWVQAAAQASARKLLRDTKPVGAFGQYFKFNLPRELSRSAVGEWSYQLGGLRTGWQDFKRDKEAAPGQFVFYDLLSDFRYSQQEVRSLYSNRFKAQLNGASPTDLFTLERPWPNIDVTLTRLICDTYLRENGVTQGDRLSMASSIELRLPLLDYRLVETVIGLRKTATDVNQPLKFWLKKAVQDLLPEEVLNRPKRGFAPPVSVWHQQLFAAYGETIAGGYLVQNEVLSPNAAKQQALGPFPTSAITPLSYKVLVLEQWCRQMSSMSNSS